ncbi:MAG: copper amine oxidase N-terminal domain-containing protein [Clostridiales bacterium]|nr:copper amine oxidase N-terminal domain-containing protein [Clostridiales bacterium]
MLTLTFGFGAGAYAASTNQTISALLVPGLKITYNGQEQKMTDASGNPVYPISYNNTTYLPVRAVSGMIGLPIEYDADNFSVNIGAEKQVDLTTRSNSGATRRSSIITDANELKANTEDGPRVFSSGIYWDIWNGSLSASPRDAIMFNVQGYNTVTFTAWSDVNASVRVYNQEGKEFAWIDLKADVSVTKTLDLTGVSKIGFAANGPTGDKGTLKILGPTLQ